MPSTITLLTVLLVFGAAHHRQQSAGCEIVARVNNDVITWDAYTAKLHEYREELQRQNEGNGENQEDLELKFERGKRSVLDDMIDSALLDQRARELGLESDPEVIKAIEDESMGLPPCYVDVAPPESLVDSDIDWVQARSEHRTRLLQEIVIQREVLAPIYNAISNADRRAYYDNHPDEFILPAKVSLSEVFLPFKDQSEARVQLDAMNLLVALRHGGDFEKAVMDYSPESRSSSARAGLVGSFQIRELKPAVAAAVSSLGPGEISDPVCFDDGYVIFRLNARTTDSLQNYSDTQVQVHISRSITMSLAPAASTNYLIGLRNKARIETCTSTSKTPRP
jgi:parvulin-like peptidyl-prolyl isomerase